MFAVLFYSLSKYQKNPKLSHHLTFVLHVEELRCYYKCYIMIMIMIITIIIIIIIIIMIIIIY